MSKKEKQKNRPQQQTGFEHLASQSDFYSASPTEKPLYEQNRSSASSSLKVTGRHKTKKRKETPDQRDKDALIAILKLSIFLVLLMISFALLWKGIGIYQERVVLEHVAAVNLPPVLQDMNAVEEFDINDQASREKFANRINQWKEAQRLVRSADALILGDHLKEAISRCNEAIELDPSHVGALSRLAELYFKSGKYLESVNAYIRVLSIDPSKTEVQKNLIGALNAFEDYEAVRYMAEWYLEGNHFDAEVQRYLANAMFAEEDYSSAVTAYDRVLQDSPTDTSALQKQMEAYIQLEQFENALVPLTTLRKQDYRNPEYHRLIAVCRAQLNLPKETVSALGRASQVFDVGLVLSWLQDPAFNVVREDRSFKAFTARVGGDDVRKMLENMAKEESFNDPVSGSLKLGKPADDRAEGLLKVQK